jgi:hypothetical protein
MDMFRYSAFWHAFRQLGTPADDVRCHLYEADYVAMKYGGTRQPENNPEPFKHRGFLARRLDEDDPLVRAHPERYQYGAYVVFPRDEQRKALYLVDVTRREITDDVPEPPETRVLFTADHFTLIVNDRDTTGNKLHLHRTEYYPNTFERGQVVRRLAPLPLEFPLGSLKDLQARLGSLGNMTRWVHAILTRPESTVNTTTGGSRGRRRRSFGRPRRAARVATFDDIFRRLPVDKLLVIAIPRPASNSEEEYKDEYDVTVFVRRRAPHMTRRVNDLCFSFEMSKTEVDDERRLRARIAWAFEGIARWEFETSEEMRMEDELILG